ncbi:MAG: PTS sugar transporter subunit IIA [Erysipelotrichaceae bacterium]
MVKLLLLSHGNLCKEMVETAKLILGDIDCLDYITMPSGIDLACYKADIKAKVDESEDGILILVDLFGGTPFMTTSLIIGEVKIKEKIEIVTGMNLPMILQLATSLENETLLELKAIALESGKDGISDLKKVFDN